MQGSLSQLRSWKLDHKEDDIRGWSLRDAKGRPLGRVAELVVDTDKKHVTEVVLGDGRHLPAHDISVGDHVLVMLSSESSSEDAERIRQAARGNGSPAAPAAPAAPAGQTTGEATNGEPLRREITGAEADLDEIIVSLIEEDVEVGKRRYEKDVTRVHSRVLERPFEHPLRLRDEHLRVERKKVDTPLRADEADSRLVDQRVEVLAITEHPITEKQARVVEEIVLTKKAEERAARLTENVRHMTLEITELPEKLQEPPAGAKS